MAIIDAGHYGIEHIYIEDMRAFLEKELSGSQGVYGACETALSSDLKDTRREDYGAEPENLAEQKRQEGDDRMNVKAVINGKNYEYPAGTPLWDDCGRRAEGLRS